MKGSKIRKQTAVQQAVDYIRNYILANKEYKVMELPPEAQIADEMGVSRLTIREALTVLESEGLIKKSQGSTTVITSFARKLSGGLDYAGELGKFINDCGYESKVDNISYIWEESNEEVASVLHIEPKDEILVVRKRFLANTSPAAYCINRIPQVFLKDKNISEKDLGKSMFEFVEERCNCEISHDFMEIIPCLVTSEIADILNLDRGSPILRVDVTKYTIEGYPIMYNTEYYVDELIRFTACRTMPYVK
jgi:GntR family transcriptional regulator